MNAHDASYIRIARVHPPDMGACWSPVADRVVRLEQEIVVACSPPYNK
jgi:hypothetical protein